MDESTVDDLFSRDRRSEAPALVDATGRTYDYHWLCTSAWKAGNFLRHAGVRRGVTVGVVGEGPLALLSSFGAALLEATVRFDPPRGRLDESVRAVVAPVDALEAFDLSPGGQRVGYGGRPTDPAVHHLESGLWSENPSFPPLDIDPETSLCTDGTVVLTHGAGLDAAREVVDEWGLEAGSRVRLDASLADPRTFVAGVIAPLLVGGTIVLGGTDSATDVDLAVGGEAAAVDRVPLASVDLPLE